MVSNVTLVIPCYNEEANIQKGVLDKVGNFTKDDKRFSKVFIVDDGSTDNTKTIIKRDYLKKFPKFTLIENNHGGKAFAVLTGIKETKTEHVMFSDIDLATPIEECERLFAHGHTHEIVIGSRNDRREGAPLSRKIMAMGGIIVRTFLVGLPGIHDTQCGFKLFNTKAAQTITQRLVVFKKQREVKGPSVSALFDIEFLFVGKKLGYKIKEVPVDWKHVETKNVNFFKDSYESLRDLMLLKWYELKGKYNVKT